MKQDSAAKALIFCALGYLVLGMTMGLITALKLIWPNLGDIELLLYGRIRTVHTNLVLFGWLFQVDMGLLFYILPRLLHTKLFSEKLGIALAVLFNISFLGGLIGILTGYMKNVEYGEIPHPFDFLIVVCWILFGINIFGTIAQRKVKYLYVAVWYTMGTVIWTAFVYLTGNVVSQLPGIEGINQANLIWFYVHNAVGLVFTPMGVAAAYYLIPKSLDTPLYSHKLSLVGFWVISFTYVWTGAHHMINGPISYWLQTVAILFSFSLIIPVTAVVTNFFGTFATAPREKRMKGAIPKLLLMGTVYYLLTCLQGPFQAIRSVNVIVSKTDWVVGHAHMALLGAFSFYAIAGVYYTVPRMIGKKLYSERLANAHFWLMTIASVPFFAVLWISGVIQGFLWLNPENTFLEVLRLMKPYHVIRMLSGALILASIILFIYNIVETCAGKGGDLEPSTA